MFDNLVCLTTTLPTTKLVNNLALILLVLNPDRMVQKFEEVFFYEPKFVNNWFWNSVVEENIPPKNFHTALEVNLEEDNTIFHIFVKIRVIH